MCHSRFVGNVTIYIKKAQAPYIDTFKRGGGGALWLAVRVSQKVTTRVLIPAELFLSSLARKWQNSTLKCTRTTSSATGGGDVVVAVPRVPGCPMSSCPCCHSAAGSEYGAWWQSGVPWAGIGGAEQLLASFRLLRKDSQKEAKEKLTLRCVYSFSRLFRESLPPYGNHYLHCSGLGHRRSSISFCVCF